MQKIREKVSNWISNAKGTLKRLLRWDEIDAPVRFKLPNLEEIKLNDLKHDTGFIIDVNQDYEKGLELFFNKTIYHWKFEIKDAATDVKELYKFACKCTELKGKENLGKICPDCGEPVKEFEPDVAYRAWLELPEGVVVPTFYLMNVLQEIIDPHALQALTGIRKEMSNTSANNNIADDNEEVVDEKKKQVELFCNLTELPLGDNLENFIEAHMKTAFKRAKRGAIQEKLDFLKENRDVIFTRNIPVISTLLRNYVYSDQWLNDTKLVHPLNSEYITIAQAIKRVKDYHDPNSKNRKNLTLLNLKTICRAMNRIDILIEEELISGKGNDGGKRKWLKDKINGHRLSYSGRAVLVPLKYTDGLYEDECILNYDIFRGVFANEIKEYMTELEYPLNYIQEICTTEKYALNDRDKKLLDDIVVYFNSNTYGLPVHINRQPSIYESSSEVVRVVKLSSEKVIRVSYTVTSDFRGDFDGDSVYVTRLPRENNYALYMMHIMNPRRYCIDYYKRYTGTTAPSKDAVILRYMGLNVPENGYL